MDSFEKEKKAFWAAIKAADARRAADRREWKARTDQIASDLVHFTDNHGRVTELEFVGALKALKRFCGVKLNDVLHRFGDSRREFDIVADSGKHIFVGEIKHKLGAPDVRRFARAALPEFAKMHPRMAARRTVVGMVGGALITEAAEKEAKKLGLIILRLKSKKLIIQNAPAQIGG